MESRWLALVSLLLLVNIALPLPSHTATLTTNRAVKQKRNPTKESAKKVASKKVATKKVATKKIVTKKVVTKKVVTKRVTTKTVAFKKKTSKKLVQKPAKTNIWMTPIKSAPYSAAMRRRIIASFKNGRAGKYSPEDLVRAKTFVHYPLKGGIRKRTGAVRYLVLHSTETERPADARRVVRSWNNIGPRHPGTQFLVDRDGTILLTADPNYATVHVNDRTSQRGVTNDNSIGIELVRSGKQKYTKKQLRSLVALAEYIEDRFNISRVYGHGEIQPSDRKDPVAFNWGQFTKNLAIIQRGQTDAETAYNQTNNPADG